MGHKSDIAIIKKHYINNIIRNIINNNILLLSRVADKGISQSQPYLEIQEDGTFCPMHVLYGSCPSLPFVSAQEWHLSIRLHPQSGTFTGLAEERPCGAVFSCRAIEGGWGEGCQ